MKKVLYPLIFLFLASNSEAQTNNAVNNDVDVFFQDEGHYEKLSKMDPSPNNDNELDNRHFPSDGWDFMKNYLLLRTNYVNVRPEIFKLRPFPANSSDQTKAEIEYMLELQKNRTKEQEDWALELADVYYDPFTNLDPNHTRYQHNINCVFRIGSVLGDWFFPENLPATKKLLVNTIHDATYYFFYFKNHFNRLRPYQLDERLKPLITVGHPSFPSGHSSANYVNAFVLSEIFPDESEKFLKKAYEMAWSRELIGVHFPSDSEIGRSFARQFVGFLMENESFQNDLEAAKKELAQKRKEVPK